MSRTQNTKLAGYIFIAAGCIFFFNAYQGKQVVLYAAGTALIAVGAFYLARTKHV